MAKLTLNPVQSGFYSTALLNQNFSDIEAAIENTLSRDGTIPNSMTASLDLNSNDILNIDRINATSLVLGGELVLVKEPLFTAISASQVSYLPPGDGAVISDVQIELQDVQTKLLATISVKDFGAVGDGVSDDTMPIQAAVNAAKAAGGGMVYFPQGTYKITASIVIDSSGIGLIGQQMKATNILPVGNFDAILITGGAVGCTVDNFTFLADGMTGGCLVKVSDADRTFIKRIIALDPYRVSYAERFNILIYEDVWANACRGDYMWMLHGEPELRGDVCEFRNCTGSASSSVDHASRATGLIWEGNVHTVVFHNLRFVVPGRGILVRNAAGGAYPNQTPSFMFGHDLEVDYPYYEGVKIELGYSMWITNAYLSNSVAESGITVLNGSSVGGMTNAFIRANFKEGISVDSDDWAFSSCHCSLNSWPSSNAGSYPGIRIGSNAERVSFSNCHSGEEEGSGAVQSYGILLESGAQHVNWTGGSLKGNLFYPFIDLSGGGNDNFEVTASGSNLSIIDNVMIGTSDGTGASASPSISGGSISSVTVASSGYGYSQSPSVFAFDPAGTGSGASLSAVLTNGKVTSINVVNGGSNYSLTTKIYFRALNTLPSIRPYSATASEVSLQIRAKGDTSRVKIGNDSGHGLQVWAPSNSVNFMTFKGNVSSATPELYAAGPDSNINFKISPKGSGRIQVGSSATTGIADVAVTGYIEILDGGGSVRKLAIIS